MRFLAEGPDIPGDLLDARDEGQVIFFCGAGVSRAEAKGPTFPELASRVVEALGASRKSLARQLLALSDSIAATPGATGIIPSDRIFSALEQEFPVTEVRRAVASALRPPDGARLGAHRTLIDLSRMPDGAVRLVTTNFDRLFEMADPSLKPILPPAFSSDLFEDRNMQGIIYLHGNVSACYSTQDSPEFVLSSADFGRAYLAEGWASRFMRTLIEKYRIVFVGYSADDPPMQYLLEALRPIIASGRLYALQKGEVESATSLWRHKGVSALPFGDYQALWETLSAWAERARDPEGWRNSIAAKSLKGPRGLEPYERGQVAHLVSSSVGARLFAQYNPAPPAEWLCSFDPTIRLGRSLRIYSDGAASSLDPFASFGLDEDVKPEQEKKNFQPPTIPQGSWSAFDAKASDYSPGQFPSLVSLRGTASRAQPHLPARLRQLAWWFGRIASEPLAVWWSAGQSALHREMATLAREAILKKEVLAEVRAAWRVTLASYEQADDEKWEKYDLQRDIQTEGWSPLLILTLAEVERPKIKVDRALSLPIGSDPIRIIHPSVVYNHNNMNIEVPARYLLTYIAATRWNLIVATGLEDALGGLSLSNLRPLHPFDRSDDESEDSQADLSSLVAKVSDLVQRLSEEAPALAAAEVGSWNAESGAAFRHLRVWAASKSKLTSPAEAAKILLALGADFWEIVVQRDVLHALKERWPDFLPEDRARLEAIMLAGPKMNLLEDEDHFELYRLRSVMLRLFWLHREAIDVSFNLENEMAKIKRHIPDWDAQHAAEQLDRPLMRSGWVKTDKSHSALLDRPLDQLLAEAKAATGRGTDFLVEAKPFKGLVESRPVRALAAIRRAALRGEDCRWAWDDLLWSEARGHDNPRFRCLIARRILMLSDVVVSANLRSVVHWFSAHSKPIWEIDAEAYFTMWGMLLQKMNELDAETKSSVLFSSERDWITEAINSPAGNLAELLFEELGWTCGPQSADVSMLSRAAQLLALPARPSVHAAAMIALHTNWLYHHAREWTEVNLLPILEAHNSDANHAAWSGFFRQKNLPSRNLFRRLKARLLSIAPDEHCAPRLRRGAVLLLSTGWFTGGADRERLVSSGEMRETLVMANEEQRLQVIRRIGEIGDQHERAADFIDFLQNAWPRQLIARSATISGALVEVALRSGDSMPSVTAAVLPLVV